MLSFIAVNENKNGSYLVLSYEDIDKSCVIATEYKTVGKTVLNSYFTYEELVNFLGSSDYKILEIKEKNDLIEDALSETKVNMDDFSDLDDTVDLNI